MRWLCGQATCSLTHSHSDRIYGSLSTKLDLDRLFRGESVQHHKMCNFWHVYSESVCTTICSCFFFSAVYYLYFVAAVAAVCCCPYILTLHFPYIMYFLRVGGDGGGGDGGGIGRQ